MRITRGWLWATCLVVAVVVLVVTGNYAGVTTPQELSDPGALTRWAMPATKFIHNMAWSATTGATIFAAAILPAWAARPKTATKTKKVRGANQQAGASGKKVTAGKAEATTVEQRRVYLNPSPEEEHPAYSLTLKIAAISAVIWTLSALAQIVFTYSDLAGMPLNLTPGFTSGMIDYVQSISVGIAWFWITVIAAVVSSILFAMRGRTAMFWAAVLSLIGIVPLALIGHSSSGDDHFAAVNAIGLHLLGAIIWVGGLMVLMMIAHTLTGSNQVAGKRQPNPHQPLVYTTLQRYSVLAGLSIAVVAGSGLASMDVRMARFTDLLEPYGVVAISKFVLTVVLGLIGLIHRQRIIPQLKTGTKEPPANAKTLLWRLIGVELVIMTAVMTVAVVLARTAPPKPEEQPPDASPARILTKYELPPELTPLRWITEWRPNWLWVTIALFLLIWYIRALLQLKARGDTWPWHRPVLFIAGLVVLTWTTSGAPAIYGLVLFSAHMVNHMTLTMVIPLLLVLGAPITLALRTLPSRQDGTRGLREWMLWLLQSWWAKFITNPVVAGINFAGSLLVFYYTPVLRFALEYHIGHEFMNVHFLLTGFIFATIMVGIDPLPYRPGYPIRLLFLLATMVFHAFIGVAMTGSESLLQAAWFSSIGRDWGPSAIADQQLGGAFMWGFGEFPTLIMAIIVLVQWRNTDVKRTARRDARVEAQGDAELDAWNKMYEQMAEKDAQNR